MTQKYRAWFYGGPRADSHARNKRASLGSGAILMPAHEAKGKGIEIPEADDKNAGPPEFVVAVKTDNITSGEAAKK